MRLATKEDFFGRIYTHYRHHEGYAKRAQLFERFASPFLVVGCGWGFLVTELMALGKDARGIDAEQWCVDNRENQQVELGNILDRISCEFLIGPYQTVITEDLLPYLSDDEAKTAAANCEALGGIVVHLVTEQGQADLNYHSTGYWMSLTKQITVSLEGM